MAWFWFEGRSWPTTTGPTARSASRRRVTEPCHSGSRLENLDASEVTQRLETSRLQGKRRIGRAGGADRAGHKLSSRVPGPTVDRLSPVNSGTARESTTKRTCVLTQNKKHASAPLCLETNWSSNASHSSGRRISMRELVSDYELP